MGSQRHDNGRDAAEGTKASASSATRSTAHPTPTGHRSLPALAGNAAFGRLVQRREDHDGPASQGAGPLNPEIAAEIDTVRGGGSALPESVGADMASQFGVDFDAVRVHTDGRADTLSRSVQATAFTVGTDVFFSQGSYNPSSEGGRELLAHELTHVVQQSTGAVGGGESRVSHPDDPAEVQARAVAQSVTSTGPVVSREPDAHLASTVDVNQLQEYGGNAAVARMLNGSA